MESLEGQPSFDQWCILELFGRQVIAGRVTEQVIGGCSFIRIDVPAINGRPAFTRFYGQGAIYAMTPVSEEAAMVALKRFEPEPVSVKTRIGVSSPKPESHMFMIRTEALRVKLMEQALQTTPTTMITGW